MQIHDTKFTSFLVNNTPVPFFPIKMICQKFKIIRFLFKINELIGAGSFQNKSNLCLIFANI